MGMRRLASRLAAGAFGAGCATVMAGQAMAQELVGQPTPGGLGLQPGVTELRHDAQFFHNAILLPMCVGISLLVLVNLHLKLRMQSETLTSLARAVAIADAKAREQHTPPPAAT